MASIFKPSYTKADPTTGERIRKRSKRWYIEYRDAEGLLRRVPGFTDLTATRQRAAELEKKAALEVSGIVDRFQEHRRRPLSEHLAEYERYLASKTGPRNTSGSRPGASAARSKAAAGSSSATSTRIGCLPGSRIGAPPDSASRPRTTPSAR